MKNTLIPFALLLCFHLNGQIPDSLNVELPWQTVNLLSCTSTMGEGPRSDNDNVIIYLESDTLVLDDMEQCQLRKKQWKILEWASGSVYDFTQIGNIQDFDLACRKDLYINYEEVPLNLNPSDLLLDLDPTHEYAFHFSDNTFNSYFMDGTGGDNVDLYVYDFTDKTICKTNIYLHRCEDDITLIFPETAEIEFNQEAYIELTFEKLGIEIDFPCNSYTTKILVGNSGLHLLHAYNVGKIVPVKVEVKFSDGIKYTKYMDVKVTGQKPAPISMYIEDKSFEAGETIDLEIWSEEISGLIAWQFQFQFEDSEILSISPSEMFSNVPFNILNSAQTLRVLWFPIDALARSIESDKTWFTITVTPNFSGNTIDLFATTLDPWSVIAIEDEEYAYEYNAEFMFNFAPRNILGIESDFQNAEIEVFPNPSLNRLTIGGIHHTEGNTTIKIYDLQGRLMMQSDFNFPHQQLSIDVSNLATGMYFLSAQNGTQRATKKISKL
jgi:hypothetical protein